MYEVINNFLLQKDFLNIVNHFFPQNQNENKYDFIKWNYLNGIVSNPHLSTNEYKKDDWMYNYVFFNKKNAISKYDKYYFLIKPIVDKLHVKELLIVRANLLVPTKKQIFHEYHTDRDEPHKVALFYVNENNGFTILKDNVKVNCEQNKILLFDGSIEHCSVSSTDNIRCVININYV